MHLQLPRFPETEEKEVVQGIQKRFRFIQFQIDTQSGHIHDIEGMNSTHTGLQVHEV